MPKSTPQCNKTKYDLEYCTTNYTRIKIMLPKDQKELIKQISEDLGCKSVNAFIIVAIEEKILREEKG